MRDKHKLTAELINQLPYKLDYPVDSVLPLWWKNIRKKGGMRLTKFGYDIFVKHLHIEEYSINLEPFALDTRKVVLLDKKLQHPYYIDIIKSMPVRLVLFDSKEAMLINLYNDLQKFLNNYST